MEFLLRNESFFPKCLYKILISHVVSYCYFVYTQNASRGDNKKLARGRKGAGSIGLSLENLGRLASFPFWK